MFQPTRKQIYIALGVLALAFLLYLGVWRESPVTVETGKAERKEFLATIDAEGRTRYHDRFTITAPISGKMFRVALHEGDNIPKGYVITRIDPAPARPTDPTQTAEANVFPYAYEVFAPTGGKVTRVFEMSERIVQAGTPIIEISQPSRLEIVIDVLSTDATRIKPNMNVIVENWGGDANKELRAKVRNVEPQAFTKISALGVEEQRVNVIADFLEIPKVLGDNFRVDARIVLWQAENVLQVSSSALFRTGENWSVFVVEGGKAHARQVEIGHRSPASVEILQGLNEGETVILHPPNTIEDGTRLRVE
jgi:multidrug efflux pump subunit AcrA (membrane-fusion protein)